ncbi:MAG: alpha/beta hydrolase [Opitutaceae bacterium]|nr:alpha/beta hydrolase [Opitutaceae bacterium]
MIRTAGGRFRAAGAALAGVASGVVATAEPVAAIEQAAALTTATGELHGTLLLPAEVDHPPVVFIHPGSGPTDRDGNNPAFRGRNDSLRQLAEGLAAAGVASLRVDKRGIAGSRAAGPAREEDMALQVFVDDVAGWVAWIRADGRFGRVILAGHSEGALIVSEAARRASPDGLVLMAGMGRTMGAVLREQLAGRLPSPLAEQAEAILAGLERGELTTEVPAALGSLYRPSVQPYLVSVLRVDPVASLASSTCPALVVQGETDRQVLRADADRLTAARPGVRQVVLDGANHLFKPVGGTLVEQLPSYAKTDPAVDGRLIAAVAEFAQAAASAP